MFEIYVYSHRKIHFVLLTGDLNGPPPDEGDEIRLLTRNDVPLLAKLYRSERIYSQRLDKGYQAVICIRNGEVVHMEWFCSRPYYIWDGRVIFDPGPSGYYLFDLYTRSDHRGRGLWRSAIRKIVGSVKDDGRHPLIFSAVDFLNTPAYSAHLRGGFTGVGLLEFRQIFGLRKWMYTNAGSSYSDYARGVAGVNTARLSFSGGAIRLTTVTKKDI
ncbi:MAG: hypothetical protein M1510_09470 [Nitrospirae bacterium]|nr:hypothetical protein [Nitrospirota bacterium]